MANLCCTSKRFIGCYGSCDTISSGINAAQTGDHIIEVCWIDAIVTQTVNVTAPAIITFPNVYNEYSNVTFKIMQPDGKYIVDAGDDCFEFSNSVKVEL